MKFKTLQSVVLKRDLLEHGLRRGDLGTVVETYPDGGLEVEFVTATGETVAVVTLAKTDLRKATAADVIAIRTGA